MTDFLGYRTYGAGTPGERIFPDAGKMDEEKRRATEEKWLSDAAVELSSKWEALYAEQPTYESTQKPL